MKVYFEITEENKKNIISTPVFNFIGEYNAKGINEAFENAVKDNKKGTMILSKNLFLEFQKHVYNFSDFDYIIRNP